MGDVVYIIVVLLFFLATWGLIDLLDRMRGL